MRPIVLVGLMGSGKSTVGRLVAERTGRRMVDSDVAIEGRTGESVRELWEEGGEAAYRAMESQVVLDALATDGSVVVAAPGGVVLDARVRAALAPAFVAWLRAEPATLAGRVRPGDHRPLLGDDPRAVLSEMAEDRSGLYASVSDLIVDVDDLEPSAVADAVVDGFLSATDQAGP